MNKISEEVAKTIIEIWQQVNDNLPIKPEDAVRRKVLRPAQNVNSLHRNRLARHHQVALEKSKDKLFDICQCSSQLPIVDCDDPRVKCSQINCQMKHILCFVSLVIKCLFLIEMISETNEQRLAQKERISLGC